MINDTIDLEKSRAVATKIRAKNTVCFLNAWNALAELRLDYGLDGLYVEGWCAGPVVVAQHGWVELPNRTTGYTIIDPTPIYRQEPSGRKYFPARSYTALEVLKLLGKRSLLPLNKDFRTWLRSAEMIEVYELACAWLDSDMVTGVHRNVPEAHGDPRVDWRRRGFIGNSGHVSLLTQGIRVSRNDG